MVVQGLIALALALPTGMLFGVGYGTGVRIGYEQVYPLLFPKAAGSKPNASEVATNLKNINKIYDTIGGKEASNMGIANGLNAVRTSTENNPDFHYLEELESKLSGRTPSSSDPHSNSRNIPSSPPAASFDILNEAQLKAQQANVPTNTFQNIQDFTKQQQEKERAQKIIDANFKLALANQKPLTTMQIKQKAYLAKTVAFQKKILSLKSQVAQHKKIGISWTGQLNALNKQRKMLQNLITRSRNDSMLKSVANSDWNKRIWNI